MSMLLAKAFKESLANFYKNGTKTGIGILMGSVDSYLARNMYSKVVLDDMNYSAKNDFYDWASSKKEFKMGFSRTEVGNIAFPGVFHKSMDPCTSMIIINRPKYAEDNSSRWVEVSTEIYFIGKNHTECEKQLKEYVFKNRKKNESSCKIYSLTDNGRMNVAVNTRTMKTVFSPQKKEIIDSMGSWLKLHDIYKEYELIHKTGILLYGKPGTGKTTFAKAIANYTNRDINIVDLSADSKIIKQSLSQCGSSVVLFEDVDCFVKNRNQQMTPEEEEKLNLLLGILDGIYSVDDCIYIATTNYIDKIDSAFKRPGRFNQVIEITDLDEKSAIEMCKHYKVNPSYLNHFSYPINPSYLQIKLLEERIKKTLPTGAVASPIVLEENTQRKEIRMPMPGASIPMPKMPSILDYKCAAGGELS